MPVRSGVHQQTEANPLTAIQIQRVYVRHLLPAHQLAVVAIGYGRTSVVMSAIGWNAGCYQFER